MGEVWGVLLGLAAAPAIVIVISCIFGKLWCAVVVGEVSVQLAREMLESAGPNALGVLHDTERCGVLRITIFNVMFDSDSGVCNAL